MSICLDRVSFSYDAAPILSDVSWCLPERGIVCLWGPSGCGKTTLLRLLAGLEKPDSGKVNGAHKVSFVFQEDRLLPWLTAVQNVTLVGVAEQAARNLLSTVGFSVEEMDALPVHLSGGQQRRVALTRALAADSDLLLLDEPFNGLDVDTWQSIVPLIRAYAEKHPVVLVTHVREQAEELGATVIPLREAPLCGALTTEKK